MFWAITFPLDQELPSQTPALLERFIRKHILKFIDRNAFSIFTSNGGGSVAVYTQSLTLSRKEAMQAVENPPHQVRKGIRAQHGVKASCLLV